MMIAALLAAGAAILLAAFLSWRLSWVAKHDRLTGLIHGGPFRQRLRHALKATAGSDCMAVINLDIGNLPLIGDSLGNRAADQVLRTAADRIRRSLRPGDVGARLVGHQFGILLPKVQGPQHAMVLAGRIQEALRLPIAVGRDQVCLAVSSGLTIGQPSMDTPDSLLARAGHAASQAAAADDGLVRLFDEAAGVKAASRLKLEAELRRALEREEFRLYFQPIVLLESGKVVEVEALIRWEHPERGLIAPIEFIPLAEETGLIRPLGLWVLEKACRQARKWQDQHPQAEPLRISVNLSAVQLSDPTLLESTRQILERTGLNPRDLKLEITESAAIKNPEAAKLVLRSLKDLGVSLALDDFGLGFSTLGWLHLLPIDSLKIDRSFTAILGQNAKASAIVSSVIALAKALGLPATAEGIEEVGQLETLRRLGCHLGQGYHFARPMPREAVDHMLAHSA